ncbi:MAG: thioesterase, partial [Rhodothermales bacterium]|nr:thioesterase [Rhodothermales bacterium]
VCDYFQEAAGNHATALGVATDRLLENGRAWVLTRLRLEVDRLPGWRERVTVETWPSDSDGLYAHRDFLLRADEDAVFGRGTSVWFVIDVARRRPVRLPEAVRALRLPERPDAYAHEMEPLPEPGETPHESAYRVRHDELDLNAHANNARYVAWTLDAVPPERYERAVPHRLDVQFRAEAVRGDVVRSACSAPPDGAGGLLRHRLTRESDGRLLAVAETAWRAR